MTGVGCMACSLLWEGDVLQQTLMLVEKQVHMIVAPWPSPALTRRAAERAL